MQPTDNTPLQAPQPPEQPKQGFWAKLFGKKPATPPVEPPHGSLAPPPQLDDEAPETPVNDTILGAAGLDVTAPPQTDPLTGAPQVSVESMPDNYGDTTARSINVPADLSTVGTAENTEGETPILPVQPPVELQSNEPKPPVNPSQPQ